MDKRILFFFIALVISVKVVSQPVSLHPENQHYLLYKGKPTVLVTSAEHYGAVLNTDFDFEKYLQTLHNDGMNYTRIFSGSYVEIPGSFNIQSNTLAPSVGNFLAPWKRTEDDGLFYGEKKFDLSEFNPQYFTRLKAFVARAEELGVIVEITFFCSTYNDKIWERNPFNPGNNINGLSENLDRKKLNTLENGNLVGFQKNMVDKIVTELNDFDNIIYEIQNEPWADNPQKVMRTLRTLDPQPKEGGWFKWAEMATEASLDWQKEMAATVIQTEAKLPKKHLIAQNYTNFKYAVDKVDPNVSIMNFHYVWPEAVWLNYGWNRPINFDESGFAGSDDLTYLRQAWQFMLAGGAIFNNLDYSFYVGKEDGTGENSAPGGGSSNLREGLKRLFDFLNAFNFIKMHPDFTVVNHSPGLEWQAISEPGKQYAIVFNGKPGKWIKMDLPRGKYNYECFSPVTGLPLKKGYFTMEKKGLKEFGLPQFNELMVMKIKKANL
jgi:hypothetical protein